MGDGFSRQIRDAFKYRLPDKLRQSGEDRRERNGFMKTYQVSLSKTYLVNITAEDEEMAKELVEFYTGDVQDISTEKERLANDFSIQEIECQTNDAIDCIEVDDE